MGRRGIRRSFVARYWIWLRRAGRWLRSPGTWRSATSRFPPAPPRPLHRGLEPGLSSSDKAELAAAKRRIAELETELHATRRAMELIREVVPPKGGSRRSR
jgi:hypothetical protein